MNIFIPPSHAFRDEDASHFSRSRLVSKEQTKKYKKINKTDNAANQVCRSLPRQLIASKPAKQRRHPENVSAMTLSYRTCSVSSLSNLSLNNCLFLHYVRTLPRSTNQRVHNQASLSDSDVQGHPMCSMA